MSSVKIYPSIFTLKYHCKSYLFSLLKNFLQNAKTRKRLDKYFARYDSFNFWTNFLYNPLFNQINVNILFIITWKDANSWLGISWITIIRHWTASIWILHDSIISDIGRHFRQTSDDTQFEGILLIKLDKKNEIKHLFFRPFQFVYFNMNKVKKK